MFKNNLAYEASAGSGKTFMLVVRYLSLLFMGADVSKILALTFTNKAASEMKERIIDTLEDLQNKSELDEIVKVSAIPKEYILLERQKILENFLNSNPKIMTIDSFFTQILRKFSLYVSLMPDFSTSAKQHEIKLLSRFLKEVSVSGKKETLVALSLESNKRVENIFTLLDEFYIKRDEFSHLKFSKINFKVFEDEAMLLLEELKKIVYSCEKASNTAKRGVEAKNFDELLKKAWLERESFDYSTFKKCYTPQMDIILSKIKSVLKNRNRAKEQNFFYALNKLVEIYAKAKKALYMEDSELSFSDVSVLVYFILHQIDESDFLYFRLDAQIEHILLDEFQDTSILQYEILKPLIDEITSGHGVFDHGSFFFVGDVKQSIYRFRGGVSSLFYEVAKEQNTEIEKLLVNYRSQKSVVDFVNETFNSKIKNYTFQKVKAEACGGYVEVTQTDEVLDGVLQKVQRLIDLGADIDEIAILCSTNGDGDTIKEVLQDNNIEVVTETTTKLINQKSVKAVIEYLKYLYFHKEIYRYNFFALIGSDLQQIKEFDISNYNLFELVKDIAYEYKLFGDDFHLVKFLDIVANYPDIEAFLFEYERIDTEAAVSDLRGVRVLTIHKSKGLEYEHVIVMDRLKKAPALKNAIIYEYDTIKLKEVYLRIRGRENFDEEYATALAKERELEREDKLNALYVAFTRAKQNLFIVMKQKDSMFEILDLKHSSIGNLEITKKGFKSSNSVFKDMIKYEDICYGSQSELLKAENREEENLKSINFGLAMHYMLEMMEDFTLSCIAHAKNMMINKYGHLLDDEEIEDIQNRVEMLLNSKKFMELVQGATCYKEQALRYKNNLRYLDLLVENGTSWKVIDYKSSITSSEEHIKQVSYYMKALDEITKEKVYGYLCYLLKDDVVIKEVNKR